MVRLLGKTNAFPVRKVNRPQVLIGIIALIAQTGAIAGISAAWAAIRKPRRKTFFRPRQSPRLRRLLACNPPRLTPMPKFVRRVIGIMQTAFP